MGIIRCELIVIESVARISDTGNAITIKGSVFAI